MICLDKEYRQRSGIYLIWCHTNGKVYVGSSANLYKRIYEHGRLLRLKQHHCSYLQHAFSLYGEQSFVCEVTLECPIEDLKSHEEEYLIKYHAQGKLFNSTLNYRGSHGMICSDEKRRKISESNQGRMAHNKGMKMSLEQRKELSDVNIVRRGKSIDVYDLHGTLLETIRGIKSFARSNGLDPRSVQRALNGEMDVVKGYVLRYQGQPFKRNRMRPLTEHQIRVNDLRMKVWTKLKNGTFTNIKQVSRDLGCSDTLIENAIRDYVPR